MQSVSSRIWTRVTVSFAYDDNHYTTGTKVVQSNKYYKSRVVGVTSEVGLTTDQDLAELPCLRNTTSFIPPQYRKSRGTSH